MANTYICTRFEVFRTVIFCLYLFIVYSTTLFSNLGVGVALNLDWDGLDGLVIEVLFLAKTKGFTL
jgi:hypothetical protein